MRTLVLCAALILAASSARPAEPAAPDPSGVVAFRVTVGVETPKTVEVRLLPAEAGGSGLACAVLDLDGDGEFETHQPFAESEDPRTGRRVRDTKVRILHEGTDWELDIYGLRFAAPDGSAPRSPIYTHWRATKGGFSAWFINAQLPVDGAAPEDVRAKPFRMGPPLEWKIGATTRGPSSLLNVGLKDANGGTLRQARRDGAELRPEVRLLLGEKEVFAATAAYG